VQGVIKNLKAKDYAVVALEQAQNSVKLTDYKPPQKIAIILGREVDGIEEEVISACDKVIEIPMFGKKESLNVVQAAAMAMYHCRFY